MQFDCGSLRFRVPSGPMSAGSMVIGHAHNFGHVTMVKSGSFKVSKLTGVECDAMGRILKAEIEICTTVRASDPMSFCWIEKGVWHQLEAMEDGSEYICAYPHRFEQAHTMGAKGRQDAVPTHKRDDDGNLWAYVDETIVEVTNNWVPAYE